MYTKYPQLYASLGFKKGYVMAKDDFEVLEVDEDGGGQRVKNPKDTEWTPVIDYKFKSSVHESETINVAVQTYGSGTSGKDAFLIITFKNTFGEVIPMPDWPSSSDNFGDFKYLPAGTQEELATDVFDLIVPAGAVTLDIEGRQWNNGIESFFLAEPVLTIPSQALFPSELPDGTPLPYSSKSFQQVQEIPARANTISIETTFSRPEGAGTTPVRILFRNQNGDELLPTPSIPQNPNFGSFIQLESSGPDLETAYQEVAVPSTATTVEFHGVDWGKKSATLYGPIKVEKATGDKADIDEFLAGLPAGTPLFVIDTTAPPLGHETLSLRPNNLTRAYEQLGVAVIFLPFSSVQEQPAVISDRVIQIDRVDFDYMLTTLLAQRSPALSTFICSSFPSIQSVTAAQLLKARGWQILYEVRDDMEEFNRVGYSKWYSPALERQMIRIADQVVSVSSSLDKKLEALEPKIGKHAVVPNGVNQSVIDEGRELRSEAATNRRNKSRTVGYVGHLTKSWFDWPLLTEAAKRMPDIHFEIVGHGMPANLRLPDNVEFLGPKTHSELIPIVADWKVGLIPFANMPLTRSVDPNKIYEYFAWGIRCVSAPMGLVHEYPSTWVYEDLEEFVAKLYEAVETPLLSAEVQNLEDFLETCSWMNRARTMLEYIGVTPERLDHQDA
ncbi:hypothetical protein CS176_0378 [Corynebacterium glutamicum]|nr:hypothetical protein CS176_0378 [Corynebacterium glutamicum]